VAFEELTRTMALTPAQIDALPDYTNTQMVKLLRAAIAELGSNPEAIVQVGGHSHTLQDLDKLRMALRQFEQAAAEDAEVARVAAGGGAPVVRFVEGRP
jgi:hypothetical protein